MAQILGMDPQEVRGLASQLDQAATQIEQIRTQLTSKLSATQWVGNDAQQFRNDWNSTHIPALNRVVEALRAAGQTANRNADAQEQTSGTL